MDDFEIKKILFETVRTADARKVIDLMHNAKDVGLTRQRINFLLTEVLEHFLKVEYEGTYYTFELPISEYNERFEYLIAHMCKSGLNQSQLFILFPTLVKEILILGRKKCQIV